MTTKSRKRRLLLKITAPGTDLRRCACRLMKLQAGKIPAEHLLPSPGLEGDTLTFKKELLEHEVDSFLQALSDLLDNMTSRDGIFPKGLDVEVSDADSREYVSAPSTIPLGAGREIRILPAKQIRRKADPPPGSNTILLKTDRAFGSGQHPSTRGIISALCLLWKRNILKNAVVLDVGTGTGILAILAAKMGAAEVLGLDIDEKILETARQNIELNLLSGRVFVSSSPIDGLNLKKQEVIVANLTPSVLFGLLDTLVEILAPEGCLVLSGYHSAAGAGLRNILKRHGLEPFYHSENEGWSTEIFSFIRSKT